MTEEKVDITFRKEEETEIEERIPENNIQDVDIMLNTGEETIGEIITTEINGFLVAVIVKVEQAEEILPVQYNLQIGLADFPNILLFDELNMNKKEAIIPLKVDYYNVNTRNYNTQYKSQADFWALNDRLRIILSGMKNLTAHIKLRYKRW